MFSSVSPSSERIEELARFSKNWNFLDFDVYEVMTDFSGKSEETYYNPRQKLWDTGKKVN